MSIANSKRLSSAAIDFIDESHLSGLLDRRTERGEVRDVIAKSMAKRP